MENRPPQQDTPPPPPSGGRKTYGAGSRYPPWVWLILLVGFGLIFYQFVPKTEVLVDYNPWFLDHVQENNIKSITFEGVEIHGELRTEEPFGNDPSLSRKVRKFYTYVPSETSIYPLELELRKNGVRIVANLPPLAAFVAWIMLVFPMFAVLGFIYLLTWRFRDLIGKNTP
jgi:cell division protease FtsH